MGKIKVLHMPVTNSGSGVTQYILQNWEHINKEEFQFDFVTRDSYLSFAKKMVSEGCKIHYITCSAEENEKQFIREMNDILDDNYDVIHLHTSFWKGFLVEEIAKERGVPIVIVHSHSTMIDNADDEKREQLLDLHNYQKGIFSRDLATNFCACSKAAAEWVFNESILQQDDIKILKNAVDIVKFTYKPKVRNEYRKKLGVGDNFLFGHVGRFAYQKNHEFLINLFKKVHDSIKNSKLLLVGEGPLLPNIKKKVEELELSDSVIFLGYREDIDCLMQAMDMLLLPSNFEGLGLVLIEGQSTGLRCLASDFIPDEAEVTKRLKRIPLNINIWCKEIQEQVAMSNYLRKDGSREIEQCGYSLQKQIKIIENLYRGKSIEEV